MHHLWPSPGTRVPIRKCSQLRYRSSFRRVELRAIRVTVRRFIRQARAGVSNCFLRAGRSAERPEGKECRSGRSPLHAEQKIKPLKDGSIELTVPAVHDLEIIPRVLCMGSSAEIIAPKAARRLMGEIVKEMAGKYDD